MEWKYYTAEGMRDQLPDSFFARSEIEKSLRSLFRSWGYDEVETPIIEFADVYLEDRFVGQEDLYKFTDPQGRLLSLRYDNTVPLARFVATSGRSLPVPLRLSYLAPMFRAGSNQGQTNHQFDQAGIELIGSAGTAADGEVLALAISALKELGLEDFQISLNHTGFYKALAEEFVLSEDLAADLPEMIDGKEFVRLDALMTSEAIPERLAQILETMMQTAGSYEVIEAVRPLTENSEAQKALTELEEILILLRSYKLDSYVSIDLGLLKKLSYYSGMIFQGYATGAGSQVVSGGRYDQLCSAFGRDLPAVGFSLDLELIYEVLNRLDRLPKDTSEIQIVTYRPAERETALAKATELRKAGIRVILEEVSQ